MDVEACLEPVSDDDPVGPESYDLPERDQVQSILDRDSAEVAANEWPGVVAKLEGMAGQTRDMWVAVRLMEAGGRAGDLRTVDEGGQLLAGLVERFWDEAHPKLEDYDFAGRANLCSSLTAYRDFLNPLKRITLIDSRLGRFTGEDLERFAQEGDGADDYGLFRAATEQLRQNGELETVVEATIERLDSIADALRRTDEVMTANSGAETSTNFQPTYQAIEQLRRLLVPFSGTAETAAEAEDGGGVEVSQGGGAVAPASAGGRIGGRVETRDDVVKALDAIADYYRLREPTSPVPVILRRARQWVTMDFMAVLADLVPGSVEDARNVLVSKADQQEEDNSGY